MGANTKTVTDASFASDVLRATSRCLSTSGRSGADRAARWPRSSTRSPASTPTRSQVVKLNVDENPRTAASYGITSIPTLNVYQGGELVKTIVGARPKAALLRDLEHFIA